MTTTSHSVMVACLLTPLSTFHAAAAVRYVDANSANPTPPYTNWATATRVIQQAVDAATPGEEIVVTNGVYQTGGKVVYGSLTNRVAVTKAVAVQSVNGPVVTVIRGFQVPGTTNGDSAVRCVYLTNGASLSGFTLANGATRLAANEAPTFRESGGGGVWCEATTAVVFNCVVANNTAYGYGGGASGGTLYNCALTGNSAATSAGGGASGSTLNNCTLSGNSAFEGGGVFEATLNNCTLTSNSAQYGGGAAGGTLNNCTLTGNSTYGYDGSGGGAYWGTLNNCIVYFNTAANGANYYQDQYGGVVLNSCCTTPQPAGGTGNISVDPQLASASHLSAASPCRGAGNAAYATGTDIDGEAWATPPSIGCDEYQGGAVSGPMRTGILATYTNVAPGYAVGLTGLIEGQTTASIWDFGDGLTATNQPYATHAWAASGDYQVVLWAYNENYPTAVSATVIVHVLNEVHYVSQGSSNPAAPYTSWATAATNIQDAVDTATLPGTLVLVANGTYAAGGRAVYGSMTNRVAVDKPLRLRSVNGPQFAVIQGYQVPGTNNGDGAIRCVYLANGASLSGFTLTNGVGAVLSESATTVVSNCVLVGNSADSDGAAASYCTLDNCTVSGNSSDGAFYCTLNNCTLSGNSGIGASASTLNNCTLSGNSGGEGGGASYCTLNNCTLSGNSAQSGGGAYESMLNNCTLKNNSAQYGGGARSSTLNNCTLTGNSATYGGGVAWGTLNNCALTGNSADLGGGAYGGNLSNCTLTGNTANSGGGAAGEWQFDGTVVCRLYNCIVYFNSALDGANYSSYVSLIYCCTTPQPAGSTDNISVDPQLASASHLSATSPCRGAGSAADASGVDIDSEAWAVPPSIGCDEYHSGSVTGAVSVAIQASNTNVSKGFEVNFAAQITGRASASRWEFGDGTVVSNRPYIAHGWSMPGDYPVVLWAYNESHPAGVSATVIVHVMEQVHYVSAGSRHPVAPYSSWATASTNIQEAVDAASMPGAVVLVSNGVYQTGGRVMDGAMTNRVAVTKLLTLRSVNGPEVTIIRGHQVPGTTNGDGAVRCVYLTNGAALVGFTLTDGATLDAGNFPRELGGGGVWCDSTSAVVSNCVLTGNSATSEGGGASGGTLYYCVLTGNSANVGGGASYCMLNNCTLTGNSATYEGGGAYQGTLNACMLVGNFALYEGGGAAWGTLNNCTLSGNLGLNDGGGAYYCTLNNCIVYYNSSPQGANTAPLPPYAPYQTLYCCTPDPGGVGSITNEPSFMDLASGDLRLQSKSPCINAGNNTFAPTGADLEGNPRIVGGTVDIGAHEFQNPSSMISYAWLQQYGLPIDSFVDAADPDGDGMSNWQEWRCGTNPTNAVSALRLLAPMTDGTNVTVTWQSMAGVNYFLERCTNLGTTAPFTPLARAIPGRLGTTSYTDVTATNAGSCFYRVGVSE